MEKNNENYYKVSSQEVLSDLQTSFDGLKKEDILTREKIYGKNILTELSRESKLKKFLKQFKDALIILLVVATVISVYLQDYRGASILAILLLINAFIGYFQEAKAAKIMQSLKKMLHPVAKVKRDGKIIEVNVSELVPGDIVFIDEWDSIPADLRIIQEINLQTNDFSLTGESNPVNKYVHEIKWDADVGQRNNVVYMWTTVATGSWYGVVFAIGMNTELGRIASLSHEAIPENTTLQNEMQNISKKVVIWTIILCILLIVIALFTHFTLKEAFMFAIGIAAAMIPEWLPAEVSIALTLASWKLAKNKALVKQLWSVETLWCVNIICTDKTWTLTKNEMTVRKIFLGGKIYDITWSGYETNGIVQRDEKKIVHEQVLHDWKHFFLGCFLNAYAKVNPPDNEHSLRYAIGDPTEAALIVLAKKAWYDVDHANEKFPEIYEFGFDSVRKMMSSIRTVDNENFVYIKWWSREVLEKCSFYYDGKIIRKITKRDRDKILEAVDGLAWQAMRNLAIAYKPVKTTETNYTMEGLESELIFLWFASIIDPPREEVAAAIEAAHQAQMKLIMITGDSDLTAKAIAKTIGLIKENTDLFMITWDNIRKQSDIQLLKDMQHECVIFCRTSPEDKLRIVSLLKANGNIVAVTWDGINDAPALKMANIWVAMGKIGTDVAKESSEIVLLDDSFATLVYAIREWRIIFQNIKKSAIAALASNGWELRAVLPSLLVGALWGIPISIGAVQILMVDLMAELIPITALTWDPAEKWLMKKPPRDVNQHIFNKAAILHWLYFGITMWGIAFANYILYFMFHGLSLKGIYTAWSEYMIATTVTYTSIVFCQYANIFSLRTAENETIFTSYIRSNKKLLWAFLISFIWVLMLIYIPVVRNYFGFGSMRLIDRLFPISAGFVYLIIRELQKYFQRKKMKTEV